MCIYSMHVLRHRKSFICIMSLQYCKLLMGLRRKWFSALTIMYTYRGAAELEA